MHRRTKLILAGLAALAATALLAIGASGAGARSLSTNETHFELIWNELFGAPKKKLGFTAGSFTLFACRVTLLGDFLERTVKKETAINQGLIFHGELQSCTNSTATIRTETMPWPVRYRGFIGRLPAIESFTINLLRATFRIREHNGIECEFASEVNHPFVGKAGDSPEAPETGFASHGEPLNITAERNNRIPLGGEFSCGFAGEGTFEGIGLVTNLPRDEELHITLI